MCTEFTYSFTNAQNVDIDMLKSFINSTYNSQLACIEDSIFDSTDFLSIAFLGERIVGLCGQRQSLFYKDIYIVVHHDFMSRGVGNGLLTSFTSSSFPSILYLSSIDLLVYAKAFKLYYKHGFKRIASFKKHVLMSNSNHLFFDLSNILFFYFFHILKFLKSFIR